MVPVSRYSWFYLSILFVIIATWTLARNCRPVSLTFCWENKHGLHSWLDVVILKYLLSDHTGSPYCLLPLADIAQIVFSSPNYQKGRNSNGLIHWGENLLLPYCLTSWATLLGIKVSMFHYFISWPCIPLVKAGITVLAAISYIVCNGYWRRQSYCGKILLRTWGIQISQLKNEFSIMIDILFLKFLS